MSERTVSARSNRHKIEWVVSFLIFISLLIVAPRLSRNFSNQTVRIAVALSPMLVYLAAIVRQVQRSDEFDRKVTLEQLAIAAAITVGFGITHALLEQEGFEKLSSIWVLPVMASVWGVLAVVERLRNR